MFTIAASPGGKKSKSHRTTSGWSRHDEVFAALDELRHELSGGRFILGAGSGLWRSEFGDLGDPQDLRVRAEMLDEGLDLLQKSWRGKPFDHDGKHYRAKGQTFYPGGTEIPIWLAASWPNRKPFRRAARFDGVMAVNQEYTNPLSLEDVSEIRRFILTHRDSSKPFNLAVALNMSGDTPADIDRALTYEAAGAEWWQEGVIPTTESVDDLRTRVRRGPPRA